MRRGNHAPPGRAFPWVIVALLAIAAVGGVAFALLRGGGDDGPGEEAVPEFSFSLGKVSAVNVAQEGSTEIDKPTIRAVRKVLDRLYTIGFVDPAEWANGSFPDLAGLFGGTASARVGRDLDDLTLGTSARGVERVEPAGSKLQLSFLLDADEQPISAVARAAFRARGTATDGRTLSITHGGRYILEETGGEWTIVAYQVEGALEAAAAATPEASS